MTDPSFNISYSMSPTHATCDCCYAPRAKAVLNKWVDGRFICHDCITTLYALIGKERLAQFNKEEVKPASPWQPLTSPPPNNHLVKVLLLGGGVSAGLVRNGGWRNGQWVVFDESVLEMRYSTSVAGWMEL